MACEAGHPRHSDLRRERIAWPLLKGSEKRGRHRIVMLCHYAIAREPCMQTAQGRDDRRQAFEAGHGSQECSDQLNVDGQGLVIQGEPERWHSDRLVWPVDARLA